VPKVSVYENKEDKDDPKNGQKIWYPEKQNVFFGTEMRSLFSAGPDSNIVLVGRDATGIELRCFAHYVNDKKYTNIILNEDIHSYHQEMAGLATRDMAKTFIYAFLYGAGDEKIGSIVMPDGTKAEKIAIGKELKAQFMAANPKLDKLVKGVKKASRRGFLIGIDGRKLMMRVNKQGRIAENKALNTLLQGADAQIMTYARVWLYDKVKEHGWSKDCIKVLDYHDEETYQSTVERSEDLKEVMIQSVVEAGLHYNFNLPLAASAEIGKTWAEIH
jgi:DNA polymerase I-like protein with 3'-5' exonuclease and polymerase domains